MSQVRVLAFPSAGIGYIDGFYQALARQGVEVIEGVFAGGWILANARRGDIAHLHWPSFSYAGKGSVWKLTLRFARFVLLLVLLRLRGVRLAWTAHNLLPHDPCQWPLLDRIGRKVVIALSERIAVHGPTAAGLLRETFPFPDHKLVLIPHGHFADQYPVSLDREAARARLGLPSQEKVVLFLGLCKPYKNVDGLIRTFLAQDQQAMLVIAGKFPDPAYEAQCRELAGASPRVLIRAGFIPDEELQVFLRAADLFVVPYREILTSGSAVLAASFGLPVVSIDKGFLHDFISQQMGILYQPNAKDGLARALSAALAHSWDHAAIAAAARQHRFEDAAGQFIRAFQ